MAYQSRLFQSRWTYEPFDSKADDFDTRVGRVLNRGAYLGDLHKSNTYASSVALQIPDLAGATTVCTGTQLPGVLNSKGSTDTTVQGSSVYSWVDATGKQLAGPAAHISSGLASSLPSTVSKLSPKSYNKEVMDLWKRVNPGVMEHYVDMPQSTMTDHFRWLPDQQEPLDTSCHFKKTDFSEYNEVAARSMKGLITNKGSA